TPLTTEIERALGDPAEVPMMLASCWDQLDRAAPAAARVARSVAQEPWPLDTALESTPTTFVHGDWKLGNLGSHPDGRTILLDWAYPGSGPACWDLCWYLALNRARLPEPKEVAIDRFRGALEAQGVNTGPWWDRQLDLCMIGI